MNLKQAHYIRTIAQEGSITAAAKKLYISQPSLSQMLKQVEAELGVSLFDRSVSPFRPTFAGEKYLQTAGIILAASQAGSGWGSASSAPCRCFRWLCHGSWPSFPMCFWRSPSGEAPIWRNWSSRAR